MRIGEQVTSAPWGRGAQQLNGAHDCQPRRGAFEVDCSGTDSDGDGTGDACELLVDGFESSDTSAWSKTVP